MPTFSSADIPRPRNWQDFEAIVLSFAKIQWNGCLITMNGRNGQSQHGVDICFKNTEQQYIGIQCKNVTKLSFKVVIEEMQKAESFTPLISQFYIAIKMSRDAFLQNEINLLSEERVSTKKFPVQILFWEDIIDTIILVPTVFEQHYPQFCSKNSISMPLANINNSVIGNIINIKTGKNQRIQKAPIQGTIGDDTYKKNYARHLIERYHEFKRADVGKKSMNYALFYQSIKRFIGFKWDETPINKFDALCCFIQKRIDGTILGKRNKNQGIKNYSSYEEYLRKHD